MNLISQIIEASKKTQKEIAALVGFTEANISLTKSAPAPYETKAIKFMEGTGVKKAVFERDGFRFTIEKIK